MDEKPVGVGGQRHNAASYPLTGALCGRAGSEGKEPGSSGKERTSSHPIITHTHSFGKWLVEEWKGGKVLPSSSIGKAIAYTLSRFDKLSVYLHDGLLEIDSNLIENAIRPIAIGRKNYLFAGSHEGARRTAIFYSFFAMCKAEEINPTEWLKYVLENIHTTKINEIVKLYPKRFNELTET